MFSEEHSWWAGALTLDSLGAFGLVLALGVLGGQLVHRVLHLPALTGYLLTGLLLGPAGLNLLSRTVLGDIQLFVDLALGLFLFELGRRLDVRWLLHDRGLLWSSLLTSTLVFVALLGLMMGLGLPSGLASLAAAMGSASSPPILLHLIREMRAEGQVSERTLVFTAVNNLFALVLFTAGISALQLAGEFAIATTAFTDFLRLLAGSLGLGVVMALLSIPLSRWLGREAITQNALLLALIALTVGLSVKFSLSPLIAALALGCLSRVLDRGYNIIEPNLEGLGHILFLVFFVYSGAVLVPEHFIAMWPVALAFLGLRAVVLMGSGVAFSRWNGLSWRRGGCLGLTLFPVSSSTLLLMLHIGSLFPAFGAQLSGLMLALVLCSDLLGPIVARVGLIASGETRD
ncbi:cation:proton antiporter [Aquaspirillum serpens]|uniref:cation:proton antiporter n=1 Tax=Aquaspirillum serpens TaxID=190 RepID=UPI0003B6A49E|nr:cation:proton antiporter [Aquaspirillum serpens]